LRREFWISITALLMSIAILLFGVGLMGTLLSVRLTFEDIHPQIKGLILSGYYIGLVLGTLQAGWVIRRAGHIRAFAIFAALSTVAILLKGLYVGEFSWVVLRILIGFSICGIYMVVESWLNERAEPAIRGRVFSIYQVISYGAIGLGQLLLPLGDPQGPELFMIVAMLFAFCLIPVALSHVSNPPQPLPKTQMALAKTVRKVPLAVVTCVGAGLLSSACFTLVPIAGLRLGLTVDQIAALMASLILGGVSLQWPIGHMSDTYGRAPVIVGVGFTSMLVAIGMTFAAGLAPMVVIMGLAALLGGLVFTLYPLSVSLANDLLEEANFVAVAATLIFLWALGAATGPFLGGYVLGSTPPGGLFAYMATISAAVTIAAICLRAKGLNIRNPFRFMTRNTPIMIDMDPRSHEHEAEDEEEPPEWYGGH